MDIKNKTRFLYQNKIDYFVKKKNNKKKIIFEIYIYIVVIVIFSFFSVYYDLFERIVKFTKDHEEYELDELLPIIAFSVINLTIFSIRRLKDLDLEIKLKNIAEKKVYEYALFDTLTKLPNRYMFHKNLEIALLNLKKTKNPIALHMIDLDKFKDINDTYGHDVGDKLLMIVSKRMNDVIREGDTVSRLGGDEFVIIQNSVISELDTKNMVERIISILGEKIIIDDIIIYISISVGIFICKNEKIKPFELLKKVDIAMYSAKKKKGSSFCLYNKDLGKKFDKRQIIKRELKKAIINQEFELYYQPQFTVTKELIGFEALLRWFHPKYGEISPGTFIPIAEENNLIEFIDEWVLMEVCKVASDWNESFSISVNVSAIQFKNKDFVEKVKKILKLTGLKPKCLEIEVIESVLISDIISAKEKMFELKKLGVKIVMDDFGTGYSNLSYLRNFTFDKIKIDKLFIDDIEFRKKDKIIIKSIIEMLELLGVVVVVEGVETDKQLETLMEVGCKYIQGFLFEKPISLKKAQKLMNERISQN